jgi:hypothetical protein
VDCERGTLQMAITLSAADGGIMGFAGKSLGVEVSKGLQAAAEALAGLIGKWDDRVYKKHLAQKATKPREETAAFFEKVRVAHGVCTVKSAVREVFEQWFELDCERGGALTLSLSLDAKDEKAVQKFAIRPVGGGTCPVR